MVSLSEDDQRSLQTRQHVLFVVSTILSIDALLFLINQTPPIQAKIRTYLLMIQAGVIITSFYMDVLFEPIPLVPALGAYCTGNVKREPLTPLICREVLTYAWLATATLLCCFFRHQTLVPEKSKMNKSRAFQAFVFLLSAVPTVVYASFPFDTSQTTARMMASPYDIGWALDRGLCLIHDRSAIVIGFMAGVVVVLAIILAFGFLIFNHMFVGLVRDKSRCPATKRKIRASLKILHIQLIVPLFTLLIPGVFLFLALLCNCISFEANLTVFSIMQFHAIAHNLILLGITPTYRRAIVSLALKLVCIRRSTEGTNNATSRTNTSAAALQMQRRHHPGVILS